MYFLQSFEDFGFGATKMAGERRPSMPNCFDSFNLDDAYSTDTDLESISFHLDMQPGNNI